MPTEICASAAPAVKSIVANSKRFMVVTGGTLRAAVSFLTLDIICRYRPWSAALKDNGFPLDHRVQILPTMHTLAHDLRYALRMMQRTRSVTAIAVLALGPGIGAQTPLS
jgi:hypothetical protein